MTGIANPGFAEQVSASFDRQNAMHLIRATLPVVEHGRTEIHVPHWDGIEQQHGFVHGGVVGMIADSAAGYAAMTMAPPDASVLTVEYKMNLVAPADGDKLIARGQVIRPGRTLIVTKAEVFAVKDGRETLCALMQQTIMVMHGKTEKSLSPGPGMRRLDPGKPAQGRRSQVSMEVNMEMKKINAGKLRAIGYDARERILRVEFEDGTAIDYSGVGAEVWRKLSNSASPWSYYRDNIEEEFTGRAGAIRSKGKSQALEDLFKAPGDDTGN